MGSETASVKSKTGPTFDDSYPMAKEKAMAPHGSGEVDVQRVLVEIAEHAVLGTHFLTLPYHFGTQQAHTKQVDRAALPSFEGHLGKFIRCSAIGGKQSIHLARDLRLTLLRRSDAPSFEGKESPHAILDLLR